MSADTNQTGQAVGNPFGDWNFVWLAYCDGSSQTSDREQPPTSAGVPPTATADRRSGEGGRRMLYLCSCRTKNRLCVYLREDTWVPLVGVLARVWGLNGAWGWVRSR